MEKIKVLMIEDDLDLSQIISEFLAKHHIEVVAVDSPINAMAMLYQKFDLIILDLTLPEIDGLELLPELRSKTDAPIIISSARDDIVDKILGFEKGADDFMPKPFDPRELVARIKNILKRKNLKAPVQETPVFELNKSNMTIRFQGKFIDFTPAEFDIMALLIERKGGIVSRSDLISYSDFIEDESSLKNIDVMVSRIRQKLCKVEEEQNYIKTIRGVGYQLLT